MRIVDMRYLNWDMNPTNTIGTAGTFLKAVEGVGSARNYYKMSQGGEYMYAEHLQGIATAQKADADIGDVYQNRSVRKINVEQLYLLAEFVEYAHDSFKIPYEKIFKKCDIETFMQKCGDCLGNYDDKLIKRYLL